jgi:diketogulonate reductase-like aldo/keto reductase
MATDSTAYELNDGTTVPALGFGTWPLRGEDGTAAMTSALENGYRYLDTAVNYENEREVGEALRRSGLAREEVRIATKVPGRFHAKPLALQSIRDSADRLGLATIDVVLIHWPNPSRDLYVEAWESLVEAQQEGLVTTVGVSNFTEPQLQRIIEATGVTPALNQVELHPYFPQQQLRQVHERLGIRTQAWSPLGKNPTPFHEEPVAAAAEAHGVSPAQAVLRWHVQLGSMPLPKSATPARQAENLDVFGFSLTEAEVAAISGLARADGRRFGGDPDTHEEM